MHRRSARLRSVRKRLLATRQRTGAAATEAALCLPLLVILTLASIEACDAIFLTQSLNVASYETIRVAVNPKATNADVDSAANAILTDHGVVDATVAYDPDDVSTVARGDHITVTISAPVDSNSILPSWFFGGRTLSASVTMVKE